jgi:hypothetical protein
MKRKKIPLMVKKQSEESRRKMSKAQTARYARNRNV